MRRLCYRPSSAMVVAVLALFIALGAGAYAAINLPANSVGTKQLKDNAVVSSKVKDRSLLAVDFKAGQLPRGARGPAGQPGQNGTNGSPGPAGTARAYAMVNANGALDANRSHNVASVTHTASGIYCVALASSVAVSGTGAVVSPFFPGDDTSTGTPGVFAHVEYAGACGTNGVQVDTFRVIPGTTTVSGSTNHTDEAFFVIVP